MRGTGFYIFARFPRMPIRRFFIFLFFNVYFKVELDIKMSVSQIHTDCFIEISSFTYTVSCLGCISLIHNYSAQ